MRTFSLAAEQFDELERLIRAEIALDALTSIEVGQWTEIEIADAQQRQVEPIRDMIGTDEWFSEFTLGIEGQTISTVIECDKSYKDFDGTPVFDTATEPAIINRLVV